MIAIGNAVGLDSTVTLGIVSSLSRSAAEVGIPNKKVNFIQVRGTGSARRSVGRIVGTPWRCGEALHRQDSTTSSPGISRPRSFSSRLITG